MHRYDPRRLRSGVRAEAGRVHQHDRPGRSAATPTPLSSPGPHEGDMRRP